MVNHNGNNIAGSTFQVDGEKSDKNKDTTASDAFTTFSTKPCVSSTIGLLISMSSNMAYISNALPIPHPTSEKVVIDEQTHEVSASVVLVVCVVRVNHVCV